jgi:hypothetical protein
MMNPREYIGSFVWFSKCDLAEELLIPLFSEDVKGFFDEIKINNDKMVKLQRRFEMLKGFNYDTDKMDEYMMRDALEQIKAHPFRYLMTCIPFAWRGLFVESSAFHSLFLFFCFFLFAYRAIKRRRWEWFAFAFITLYLYGMNTVFSTNIPRYNRPLIPVLYVCTIILFLLCYERCRKWIIDTCFRKAASRKQRV